MDHAGDSNDGPSQGRTLAGTAGAAMTSVTQAVNGAYQQAPDLGVTSTIQAAYAKAPDMGVSRGLNRLTGAGAGGPEGHDSTADHDVQSTGQGSITSDSPSNGAEVLAAQRRERIEESKSRGPSDDSRLEKSQSQIGIEDGVPTSAGLGTTLSPDAKAQESAQAGAKRREAHVPEDFENVACPSEHGGNKDAAASRQTSATTTTSEHEHAGDEAHHHQADGEKQRGLGRKLKDLAKGEAKIISGRVRKDEDKVASGQAIKRGEVL
ncbi:unnamed protein product [Parajaminaea phylloscopi]